MDGVKRVEGSSGEVVTFTLDYLSCKYKQNLSPVASCSTFQPCYGPAMIIIRDSDLDLSRP